MDTNKQYICVKGSEVGAMEKQDSPYSQGVTSLWDPRQDAHITSRTV